MLRCFEVNIQPYHSLFTGVHELANFRFCETGRAIHRTPRRNLRTPVGVSANFSANFSFPFSQQVDRIRVRWNCVPDAVRKSWIASYYTRWISIGTSTAWSVRAAKQGSAKLAHRVTPREEWSSAKLTMWGECCFSCSGFKYLLYQGRFIICEHFTLKCFLCVAGHRGEVNWMLSFSPTRSSQNRERYGRVASECYDFAIKF